MLNAQFYVYIYYTPEIIPFYVGMGKNNRYIHHLNQAIKYPTPQKGQLKLNKIRKLLKNGEMPIIKIIAKHLYPHEAQLLEKKLIKNIGRIDLKTGPLTNLCDGGEGVLNPSLESRKIRSDNQKGKILCRSETGNAFTVDKNEFNPLIHTTVNKGKTLYTNGIDYKILYPFDPLIKSGEYYRYTTNKCVVVINDKPCMVTIEEKNKMGYVSINKGKIAVIDLYGNKFLTNIDDPKIKNGELKIIVGSKKVLKCKITGKLKTFDKTEEIPTGYEGMNKGGTKNLITVKDSCGDKYRVFLTDERIGKTLFPI